ENKTSGADCSTPPVVLLGSSQAPAIHVVIQKELVGMRAQAQRVVFLALVFDPHLQEVARKDVALEQEVVVVLQMFQRFGETARHLRNLRVFFGRQLVEV